MNGRARRQLAYYSSALPIALDSPVNEPDSLIGNAVARLSPQFAGGCRKRAEV